MRCLARFRRGWVVRRETGDDETARLTLAGLTLLGVAAGGIRGGTIMLAVYGSVYLAGIYEQGGPS